MVKCFIVSIVTVLGIAFAGTSFGYEAKDVKNGATIKGIVKFNGSVPVEGKAAAENDLKPCEKAQRIGAYLIKDSKVKNAVVFIDNPKQGKSIPKNTSVDMVVTKCRMDPLVSIGFVGGKFLFRNEDDILHTIQLKLWLEYQKKVSSRPVVDGATIYNLALPNKGKQIEKPIKNFHRYQDDTGVIRITSNTDLSMRGYVFVFDHPYAAVTDENGVFAIDNLPPGEYTLTVWHEGFGMQKKTVKVAAGETGNIEIVYEK